MKNWKLLIYTLSLLLIVTSAFAGFDVNRPKPTKNGGPNGGRVAAGFNCSNSTARAELNINNIRALILNGGDMWWDLVGSARYEVPKQTDPSAVKINALFAGGIWIGGLDPESKAIIVTAQTYRQNGQVTYWPGPLDSLTAATNQARCSDWDQMFEVKKNAVLNFIFQFNNASGGTLAPTDIDPTILYWPGRNNKWLKTRPGRTIQDLDFALARFVDRNLNGEYEPEFGDYPQLPGDDGTSDLDAVSGADQCIFWVVNDRGNAKKFNSNGATNPGIGIETQSEAFAYATSDQRNNMTFYRNRLINKGTTILSKAYFGQWVDPDLGFSQDDYVGCDVPRGLGICYNGEDFDPTITGYGANPPSIAVDFFTGPTADPLDGIDNNRNCIIDEEGERIIMSSFMYYNNSSDILGGNPSEARDYYMYLQNRWSPRDDIQNEPGVNMGQRVSYDNKLGKNKVSSIYPFAKYIFPGTSDQTYCFGTGGGCAPSEAGCLGGPLAAWDERSASNPPGDRRFLSPAGPFTLKPGAVNELTVGVIWARANSGGAIGSLGQLLVADDASQKLFDRNFKIILGPNEPAVGITELDGELILSWQADTFLGVFTDKYTVEDPFLVGKGQGGALYKFQGYIVYQLADGSVSSGEFYDPSRAKILFQCDIKDGVTSIYNSEFSTSANAVVPTLKVTGSDKGITNSIRITRDLFNPERDKLINFQRYYYRVVAYAYNGNNLNTEQFLISRPKVGKGGQLLTNYTAIPHKTAPENGGTVLLSNYGQQFPITRIFGAGTGGARLDSITAPQYDSIVSNSSVNQLKYSPSVSPLVVKVFDPKKLREGDFTLKIFSRLVFKTLPGFSVNVGDTLVSTLTPDGLQVGALVKKSPGNPVAPATAVVIRKKSMPNDSLELTVNVLNDEAGGTFGYVADGYILKGTGQAALTFYNGTTYVPATFYNKNSNQAITPTATLFAANEFWQLTDNISNQVIYNTDLISSGTEQLLQNYGLSIKVVNKQNPAALWRQDKTLGILPGAITYSNPSFRWLVGVPNTVDPGPQHWLASSVIDRNSSSTVAVHSAYVEVDDQGVLVNILNGSWAPGLATLKSDSGGVSHPYTLLNTPDLVTNVNNLRNVDVVFTGDRSKWTKVIVLQKARKPVYADLRMFKCTVPSVDINGQPSGEMSVYDPSKLSTGTSYFPGYAVDIERGIRMNMAIVKDDPTTAFSNNWVNNVLEFKAGKVSINGNNQVLVLTSAYDKGAGLTKVETVLDSISALPSSALRKLRMRSWHINNQMWAGFPAEIAGIDKTRSEATVKLRVDRSFQSWPTGVKDGKWISKAPTYNFKSKGFNISTNNTAAGRLALDLIRVVPNPYYSYSQYETSQIDNRVKITNLPGGVKISIYNLSGSLVRTFSTPQNTADINQTTFLDWDLKNQDGLPIASGVYLVVVDAGELGQKVVKFFGTMRPLDLDGVSQN